MIIELDDPRALDAALVGAKAANLARAHRTRLPALSGAVLTTSAGVVVPAGAAPSDVVIDDATELALRALYRRMAADGRYRLVARSSSTVEDLGVSSMAGRFTSVLGIDSDAAMVAAVRTVLASAASAAAIDGVAPRPMAVLVQRQIQPALGGVLFGVDPVTGDRHHVIVEAAREGPEVLVSGRARGVFARLGRLGGVVEGDADARALMNRRVRWRLVRVSRRAWSGFEGPQDIEWIVDPTGKLWVLQTRPVTAVADATRTQSALLGQGPLGETFPQPLRPLEQELWIAPMATAMREAIGILGVVSRRRLRGSPVVTTVNGWAVCDLELIGVVTRRSGWRRLTPFAAGRRLRAAWRVGRLANELAPAAHELVDRTREMVAGVAPLATLSEEQLLAVLTETEPYLVSLHGQQMLAGVLFADADGAHLATVALEALRAGRAEHRPDAAIVATSPVTLGLVAPRIGGSALPRVAGIAAPDATTVEPLEGLEAADRLVLRDLLRWWSRLVQELQARVAGELGRRLCRRGVIGDENDVALLSRDELVDALRHAVAPVELELRRRFVASAPVPSAFRLDRAGDIVPDRHVGRTQLGGRGAAGGRATGTVVSPDGALGENSILVVPTLDPALAPLLPRVGGIVAETGSVLSHLAILAREFHVPTVVAVDAACERFPPGTVIAIDGRTGEVRRCEKEVSV